MIYIVAILISIVSCQEYKYLVISDNCYKQIVNDGWTLECVSESASRAIGMMIVVFSILNQMPQIYNIVKHRSIQGISLNAFYNESYLISFNIAYNMHKGQDFMLYGENVFILGQFYIIILLFLKYDTNLDLQNYAIKILIYLLISVPLLMGYGPDVLFNFTIYINMILLICSRMPQIMMNYRNKSTGQMAFLTQIQNQAGVIARLFTLFVSGNDLLYTSLVLEDNILCGTITCQFLIYQQKYRNLNQYK